MSNEQAVSSMVPTSTPIVSTETLTKPIETNEPLIKPIVETKKEESDYSSRFAALSRREKQLVEREKSLKDYESKAKDADSFKTEWEQRKVEMKKNPDLIFEEIGMSFDDIINFKLGIKKEAEEKNLDPNELYKRIKHDLEVDIENKAKAKEDEQLKQQQSAQVEENALIIESFKQSVEDTLKSQSDKYELINYQGDFDLVFQVIENYFNEHQEVLPIEEAANHVEAYLEELVDGANKLKKIQAKLIPKPAQLSQADGGLETNKVEAREISTNKTLSNTMQSTTNNYLHDGNVVDVEESKRRAAALLRWTK